MIKIICKKCNGKLNESQVEYDLLLDARICYKCNSTIDENYVSYNKILYYLKDYILKHKTTKHWLWLYWKKYKTNKEFRWNNWFDEWFRYTKNIGWINVRIDDNNKYKAFISKHDYIVYSESIRYMEFIKNDLI